MVLRQIRCTDIRSDGSSDREPTVGIEPLAESIRSVGVLRPVLLRWTEEGYVIVHGERRWRAAQMAGLEKIPAYLVQSLARDEFVPA
jgi:ParB/RepB/Spo0J family partition protein